MANEEIRTDIKFSSVEDAVRQITEAKDNMESELDNFTRAVRTLIQNGDFVGSAADSFEDGFERLKKEKFDSFISLVKDFSTVITKGKVSTEETARAAEADATTNLYLG